MKNKLIILMFLTACGGSQRIQIVRGQDGKDGESITGPQGPTGQTGATGAQGIAGSNGTSCSVTSVLPNETAPNGGALITCGNTSTLVLNGRNGLQGANGHDGASGHDGHDGHNGSNGHDGADGEDAQPSAFDIESLVDPCGTTSGYYNEIFLHLRNGTLVALISDDLAGNYPRLAIIPPSSGPWLTADHTNCTFSVNSHGDLYNEHR